MTVLVGGLRVLDANVGQSKYGVFTEREIHSRYEILLENYIKTIKPQVQPVHRWLAAPLQVRNIFSV